MVTNTFVNSLNMVTEMAKTSKPAKTPGDDKFKELMNKDDANKGSDDKKIQDEKAKDDGKVDKTTDNKAEKTEDDNQLKTDGTYEKVMSGEVAKMLVNVSPIVTDVNAQVVPEKVDAIGQANMAVAGAETVETAIPVDGLMEDGKNINAKGTLENSDMVNGNIAANEGKIQLNEGFKPVDEKAKENLNVAELLKDGMGEKVVSDEKVDESLVVNVAQNDASMSKVSPMTVNGSQEVVKSESVFKPEETIDNMVKTFVKEFSQGRREMEIQLEPVNLGKLTIKVAYEAGKAVVSILCTERNLDIISRNSAQIAGILQQYTGDDTQVVVEQPQFDYLNQQNEKNDQRQQGQEYKANEKTDDDKEAVDFLEQLRLGLVKEV